MPNCGPFNSGSFRCGYPKLCPSQFGTWSYRKSARTLGEHCGRAAFSWPVRQGDSTWMVVMGIAVFFIQAMVNIHSFIDIPLEIGGQHESPVDLYFRRYHFHTFRDEKMVKFMFYIYIYIYIFILYIYLFIHILCIFKFIYIFLFHSWQHSNSVKTQQASPHPGEEIFWNISYRYRHWHTARTPCLRRGQGGCEDPVHADFLCSLLTVVLTAGVCVLMATVLRALRTQSAPIAGGVFLALPWATCSCGSCSAQLLRHWSSFGC